MIHQIELVNVRTDIKELIVFSTYVTTMYLKLDILDVAKITAQE